MKAILIDVVARTVSYTDINHYTEIYPLIGNGCSLFCVPVEFENGDALYSDDEGLLHNELHGCFMLKGWGQPLVGNAIIWGTDEEGDSVDCKTTIEEIQSQIAFYSKDVAEKWRDTALNNSPIIITSWE